MFKKLDILIIRSFVGPFIVTFFVSLFVLVMQFFWLYMDEMIGKGLGVGVILQSLLYTSATLVPLALPLSILLASIMTFGALGENFELVAIKASGISLLRFIRPLFFCMIGMFVFAFFFNNNVIPIANLKSLSLLFDIRNMKPTLSIKPEHFNNEIKGYSIRVGSKDPDGYTIHDIIIYDHSDMAGSNKVTVAKEGMMLPTPDKQTLIFRLKDGWRYEEGYDQSNRSPELPQTRMHFDQWDKVFDLSQFKFTRTNEDLFKKAYQMMDVKQLSEQIDSFDKMRRRTPATFSSIFVPYLSLAGTNKESQKMADAIKKCKLAPRTYKRSFMELVDTAKQSMVLQGAANNMNNLKGMIENNCMNEKIKNENYEKFGIEFHRKFSLSFACMLLFLIGAPLGAIIRKGGIGLPLVFAVVFFLAFIMINISGEKLVKSGSVPAWMGMWMSTFIMLPIAFWLIFTARNDSKLFTKEWYTRNITRLTNKLRKKESAFAE